MQGVPNGGVYPPRIYDYHFPLPNNYPAAPPTYGYEGRYGHSQGYAPPYYGGYPTGSDGGHSQEYAYDRQRMDPWHGYNGYSPGNGY
jgi:hypothetical protein